MLDIGKYNRLRIYRIVEFGAYLTDGEAEVLLPKKFLPADKVVGDSMEVFVYLDSEDRPVATTRKPYGTVGEMKVMTVVDANNIGAFVDWGLEKDLLVPFRHQKQHLLAGKSYPIMILFDEVSRRIIGSNCLEKYYLNYPAELKTGDEVRVVVYSESDLGYNVLVNNEFIGIIYRNEVFRKLEPGDHLKAYVKKVREDGKLDIMLRLSGYQAALSESEQILRKLQEQGGFFPYDAKSSAEVIQKEFGMSRKTFKQILGALYKEERIKFEDGGTRFIK